MEAKPSSAAVAAAPVAAGIDAERYTMWLLGSAVLATALGVVAATFRGDGTAINAFLFMTWEWPAAVAGQVERMAVVGVLAGAIAGVIWRAWATLPLAAYVFLEALCRWQQGGQFFSDWSLLAHAPRYLTPVALAILAFGLQRPGARNGAIETGRWTLRLAIASVFAIHGVECIAGHPQFVDIVISSAQNLAGIRIAETSALAQLEWIGIADCVVAAAVIIRPHRAVMVWAAFWGAVSAFSRVTANGWAAYPDVLVRSSHLLVPLALVLLDRIAPEPTTEAAAPSPRRTVAA